MTQSAKDKTASQEIDAVIKNAGDWRGNDLAQIRAVIKETDQEVLEKVKWGKRSKPEGVPVWSHGGILCMEAVRMNV